MTQLSAIPNSSPFDAIRHEDEQGEWWSARELGTLLGYKTNYRNFTAAIDRAQKACENSGNAISDHFAETRNMIETGKGAKRAVDDYRLTRYACYLVAQNADPTKEIVAQAQSYFAFKTRQREEDEEGFFLDNPEEWLERAIRSYMSRGYSEAYARNRIDSILARNRITGQWTVRGITQEEIPILTDRLHMGTFDISVEQHKGIKDFPIVQEGAIIKHKGNLRPALTPREMAVLTFAENITAAIHVERDSQGFQEIARDVDEGAGLAKEKRMDVERVTGSPVVSSRNMLNEPDGGLWAQLAGEENPEA